MRRFILVDASAAEDIVSSRTLQSDDFDHGKILGAALKGTQSLPQLTSKTYLVETQHFDCTSSTTRASARTFW